MLQMNYNYYEIKEKKEEYILWKIVLKIEIIDEIIVELIEWAVYDDGALSSSACLKSTPTLEKIWTLIDYINNNY